MELSIPTNENQGKSIIAILTNKSQGKPIRDQVVSYLNSLPEKKRLQGVKMNMWLNLFGKCGITSWFASSGGVNTRPSKPSKKPSAMRIPWRPSSKSIGV